MISIYDDTDLLIYCSFMASIIGAVFGSFLNCTAYRIVHGENFTKGRSHCTSCGHELSTLDLIPVLSWVFLKGKCRYCGKKVSVRYPLTELFFSVMAVCCLLKFDLTVLALRNFIFACCLFCLSLADMEGMTIPDGTLIIAAAAYLILTPLAGISWKTMGLHLLAGLGFGAALLLISLVFDRILGKESMGGGDIKLFALCGLYLGFVSGMFTVILACVIGLVFVAVWKALPGKKNPEFPFGPSVALSAWIVMLYGEPVVNWYLGLIGL